MKTEAIAKKKLRSFGLIVGSIFFVIGAWPLIRGQEVRTWSLALAVALGLPAFVFPMVLKWPFIGWMWIGEILGWINTRLILGLVFYVLITPISLLMGLFGKDTMGRKFVASDRSYRVIKKPRSRLHFERMF